MSASGYKRKSGACRHYIRLAPNTGHSSADVGFSPDYVCFTPRSRRSRDPGWTSAFDPKEKLVTLGAYLKKCQS